VECAALFSFIGADPASEWLSGCAALDDHRFVLTDRALADEHLDERWAQLGRRPLPFETSHPGLFAVGDLRSGSTKRVAAAVGEGSAAVPSVHQYLASSMGNAGRATPRPGTVGGSPRWSGRLTPSPLPARESGS